MDLNLLKSFEKLAELGSYTKAAQALNQPKSRLSRAISRLEEEMGIQLVRRTTRQTALTSAGQDLYQRTHHLLEQLEQQINEVVEDKDEVKGTLRITAPEDMAQTLIASFVADYTSQYPKVEVETVITNDFLDLTKENIDIAFRIGKLDDSQMIQKKLMDVFFVLVASPQYLKTFGHPTLENIEGHRFMAFRGYDFESLLITQKGPRNILRSDNFSMLLSLAKEGKAMTVLPNFFAQPSLDNGLLEQVFCDWKGVKTSIHMLYSPTRNLPKRTRCFLNLASEKV